MDGWVGQGECKKEERERERQQRKTRNGEINNKERERWFTEKGETKQKGWMSVTE